MRFDVDIHKGLNDEQVRTQKREGLVNITEDNTSKSYKQIIFDNVFTLFNFINVVLAILILFTGSIKNMAFMGVVISNILIGTIQEIRAKITLDKISLIHTMKVNGLRNGKDVKLEVNEIVLDDILKIKTGNQIVSDSILKEGTLEVDESLLTGESEEVIKQPGDFLYSGSFVISGSGIIQVERVGSENYASKMIKDAKKFSKYPSELRDTMDKIIKYIGIAIIPLGIIMFSKHLFVLDESVQSSILSTSAALIGMIPEGLVILTSIALAVGVMNLARHKTLVQELYCIETLARVDVLCLDKTGTITEGRMMVSDVKTKEKDFEEIMSNLTYDLKDDNPTINAIRESFQPVSCYTCLQTIPFSSSRKFSGAIYEEGIFLIGAYNFMCKNIDPQIVSEIEEASKQGYRVITLMKTSKEDQNFDHLEFMGHILLLDKIRDDAKETLDYFDKQGVDIKIISGDHPVTVSHIGRRVGLKNYEAYVDASTLSDEELENTVNQYQIFGRVTPEQKKKLVLALKKQGHTVGMSGDGVNDVLAFKEADVSIAMASGSDVAKSSANLVLLDSNFDALPEVLNEGRRVINNIQRVATLFLTKTIFSILLTFITIVLPFEYPFVPIHLTFVSTFTIGIPAFFMALEPNKNRVENKFLENIVKVSLPSGLSVIVSILMIYGLSSLNSWDGSQISQLAVVTIALNGLLVLTKVSFPLTLLRKIILICASICVISGFAFASNLISILPIDLTKIGFEIILIAIVLVIISQLGSSLVEKIYRKVDYGKSYS